ncbi:uncharacterized protein LOC111129369 isoform X3 [Crassostrea virginica]
MYHCMETSYDFSILELRKEKSRDAARSRRGKENYEFYELAKLLPLPAAITSQLDKASIIRLSISYLKLRDFSGHGDPPWNRDHLSNGKSLKGSGRRRNISNIAMDIFDAHQGTHILQSLDGFAFILANDGRFLYISETVSIYLGLSQVEMTGSSIFDYVHVQDHQELLEHLGLNSSHSGPASDIPSPSSQSDGGSAPSTPRPTTPPTPERANFMAPNPEKGCKRTFCLRMKSTLTKRGVHIRTSGYRVVYITGHIRPQPCFGVNRKLPSHVLGLVGIAVALPPPTITELRIESDTFIMRLNPDFSIIYCDTMISELCDWSPEDVIGKPIYDFCHPADLHTMKRTHKDLLAKGQVLSDYYRMINKNGGYSWAQICASTLYSSKTSDTHTVLAIIYILSGVEYENCVMDVSQLLTPIKTESHKTSTIREEIKEDGDSGHSIDTENDHMDSHQQTDSLSDPPKKKRPSSNGSDIEELHGGPPQMNHPSPPVFVSHDEEDNSNAASNLKLNCGKVQYKNSRRKMEKPRKRHRGSLDSDSLIFNESFGQELSNSGHTLQRQLSCASLMHDSNNVSSPVEGYHSHSASPKCLDDYNMPAPEDLSLRSLGARQDTMANTHRKNCWHSPSVSEQNSNRNMVSVKFLEDVMNKHLPNLSQLTTHDIKQSASISDDITSNNTVSSSLNKQPSPIHWTSSETETHPASNLLRTLYAKRESVIRSSNHSRNISVENSALSLLTPPGNDGFKEQLTLNIPQISVNAKGSVLPSYTSASHQTVSTATESFNMTPPSSVSPTEKLVSPFVMEGNFDPVAGVCSTLTHVTSPPVTLKSQAFPLTVATSVADFNCVKTTGYNNSSPAYHVNEYPHLTHTQNSFLSYDMRPDAWYPVSFQS